ncbi:hypothetical protein [Microbacterium gorillae]|uniref:hypothetical protein n=1 Tax=Microbacterium gorillae TaxID=1231063 RepID=UPI003D9696EA
MYETEPNGTTAQADPLALGTTIGGSTSGTASSDSDFFRFTAPKDGQLSLGFSFPSNLGTGAAYLLSVLDASGNDLYVFTLKGGDYSGAWASKYAMFLAAGDYFIRVKGYSYDASWGAPYSLKVGVTPGVVETEGNNTSSRADALVLGTAVKGSALGTASSDSDFFRFTAPKDGQLSLGFSFPSNLGTGAAYLLSVLDASGNDLYVFTLKGGDYSGAWASKYAMFLAAGDYFIRVKGYSYDASWGAPYSLKVGVTPGVVETERNNTSAQADTVAFGKPVKGSTFGASSSDSDYFRITAPRTAKYAISLGVASGLGTGSAYDVVLTDVNGSRLGSWNITGNGAGMPSTVNLTAGTFYLQVRGYSYQPSWGAQYTLRVDQLLTATPTPTVSGSVKVGSTLTAVPGTWKPSPVTLKYQWKRDGVAISGATAQTYRLTAADAGHKITVTVTGSKSGYKSVSKTSAATATVPKLKLSATPTPTVSGTAKAGSTLTATPGTWKPSPVTLKYQWRRDGVAISGATAQTYRLTTADKGHKITVTVTGSKTGYTSVSKTSASVAIAAR